jgi:hypothetical protein
MTERNAGDKIADGFGTAADITDAISQEGLAKTGKAVGWLRLGNTLASVGARLFGKKK